MLTMRIDSMIAALVRSLLITPGGQAGKALYFHIDCRLAYYGLVNGGGPTYTAARGLHLVYHLRPHSTYVDVFSAIQDSPFDKLDATKLIHESSHDTCWRDDVKAFSKVYFGMAEEINRDMVSDGHPEVAPARMDEHNSFPIFDGPFSWIDVEVTKDAMCSSSYRKKIAIK